MRVPGREAEHFTAIAILAVAVSAASLAAGVRPTGALSVDALLVFTASTLVVSAGSFAPWWLLGSSCVVGGVLASPGWGLIAAAVGAYLAFGIVPRRRGGHPSAAAASGLAVVAAATMRDVGPFGTTTVIGVTMLVAIVVIGTTTQPRRLRRLTTKIVLILGAFVIVGVAGLAVAAWSVRSDLVDGEAAARRGLESVRSGDIVSAESEFAEAAARFRRANRKLNRPWVQPSRLIPIAAQHWNATNRVSAAASRTSRLLEAELGAVDLSVLRPNDGRFDIERIRALRAPVDRVSASIDGLRDATLTATDHWLVPRFRDRLSSLGVTLDEFARLGQTARDAVELAPDLLGDEQPRVYFVMLTTPAEARGQGGFMGNYVELTVDDGAVSLTDFGRHADLSRTSAGPRRLTEAPDDWLARYGRFGFTTGPNGTVGDLPWSNITMSANFPATAQVVAELYPQSGGRKLDGVISLDVIALQRLVGLVGSIPIDGTQRVLDGSNTARFLLVGQYQTADIDERVDLLEQVALATVDRLLQGDADPAELLRTLRPMFRQRRMIAWSPVASEQALFTAAGVDGALLGGVGEDDGIAITVVNASGNKIDTFLTRDFSLNRVGGDSGSIELTIDLGNDPPLDLPDYVVDNLVDLPRGSSRLFLSVHTTMRLVDAQSGGRSLGFERMIEADEPVYSTYVDIGPGAHWLGTLTLEPATDGASVLIQPQPLALPEHWAIGDDVVTVSASRRFTLD